MNYAREAIIIGLPISGAFFLTFHFMNPTVHLAGQELTLAYAGGALMFFIGMAFAVQLGGVNNE
jgi:hypothetical protein